MRHFIKYVLVTAVLLFGFHTASKYKASSPEQSTADVAESETAALSSHPDAQPVGRDTEWRAPVAALSDTERSPKDVVETESSDGFKHSAVRRQPIIKRPSSVDPYRLAEDWSVHEDWSSEESSSWDEESPDHEPKGSHKPNAPEKPNVRKRSSTAKDSRPGKKAQDSGKRNTSGKADDAKRTRRPVESARGSGGTGSNDTSRGQVEAESATPEWPIGERLASSSKATFAEQLRKESQRPWQDRPETASRRISPFDRDRAGDDEDPFRSNDGVDRLVPKGHKPRQPEKPAIPASDEQRRRMAKAPERHQIVEGDTLPKLAVAYLGDRDRYLDIFRANRDVLSDPRLLPIGEEIAIPADPGHDSDRSSPPSLAKGTETEWANDDGELVPIPTFALPPRVGR